MQMAHVQYTQKARYKKWWFFVENIYLRVHLGEIDDVMVMALRIVLYIQLYIVRI